MKPKTQTHEELDATTAADWGHWAYYAAQAEPDAVFVVFAGKLGVLEAAKLTADKAQWVRQWAEEEKRNERH